MRLQPQRGVPGDAGEAVPAQPPAPRPLSRRCTAGLQQEIRLWSGVIETRPRSH